MLIQNDKGILQGLTTDEQGKFSLPALPPGQLTVKVSGKKAGFDLVHDDRNIDPRRHQSLIQKLAVVAGEKKVMEPFRIKRIPSIAVEVIAANGTPIADATVQLISPELPVFSFWPNGDVAKTGPDGIAQVVPSHRVEEPSLLLCKWHDGQQHLVQTKILDSDSAGAARVKFGKMTSLRGRVTLNKTKPLSGVTLKVTCHLPNHPALDRSRGRAYFFELGTVISGDDGEYVIDVPATNPAGGDPRYYVSLRKGIPNADFSRSRAKRALLVKDGYLQDFNLVNGDQSLSGTVKDEAGNPVANIRVYLNRSGPAIVNDQGQSLDPHDLYQAATVRTDAEGRFEIRGLPSWATYSIGTGGGSDYYLHRYTRTSKEVQAGEREIELLVAIKE